MKESLLDIMKQNTIDIYVHQKQNITKLGNHSRRETFKIVISEVGKENRQVCGRAGGMEAAGRARERRRGGGAEVTDQLGGGHIDSPACLIGAASPRTPYQRLHTPLMD